MKNQSVRTILCILLSIVMLSTCFSVFAVAAGSISIVKQPAKRTLYQGVDWTYSKAGQPNLVNGIDLTGTKLSSGGKTVEYVAGKFSNMYAQSSTGKWAVGSNTINIYCDNFSGYATTTVTLVSLKSISLVSPPANTILVKDLDWKQGPLSDVELTNYDITGLTIKAAYTDGISKTLSYPDNQFIGWSVSKNTDILKVGTATLYATFCGMSVPFNVEFVNTNPHAMGDVNKDSNVNSADALAVLQHATGKISLDYSRIRLADINKDKNVNSYDALMILQYVVGIRKSL